MMFSQIQRLPDQQAIAGGTAPMHKLPHSDQDNCRFCGNPLEIESVKFYLHKPARALMVCTSCALSSVAPAAKPSIKDWLRFSLKWLR